MEAYYAQSSSSSSPYSSSSPPEAKPSLPFHASLHTVRKPPSKPWKKPVAPLPPTPTLVYKVKPIHFKEVVQKLTGAPKLALHVSQKAEKGISEPEFQSRRLQSVAPPPLNVVLGPSTPSGDIRPALQLLPSPETPLSSFYRDLMFESLDSKPRKSSDSEMASSTFEIGLSPSSLSWCSGPLLSPGTRSSLEQSTVL